MDIENADRNCGRAAGLSKSDPSGCGCSEIYGRNADQGGNEDFVLLAVKNAFVNNGYLYNIQVAADPWA